MQQHISEKQIQSYQKRQLSPKELLALDDHLAECEGCREQISGIVASRSTPEFVPALNQEAFEHPVYEQFAAYVDGQLDSVEREMVESHLACCRQCSKELSDLETTRTQVAAFYLETKAEPPVEKARGQRATWREKLTAFWSAPSYRIPLRAAAAIGCVALLMWAVTLPLWKEIDGLKTQLVDAERRNEELKRDFEISKADTESLQNQIAQLQSEKQNLQPEAGALALDDGGVKIDRQGSIEGVASLPSAIQQSIKSAIDTAQAKTPQSISSLISRAGVLMGGGQEGVAFALESPVGTAVLSTRPTFRWQPLEGATGYSVTVLDIDFNPIVKSLLLVSTSWTASEPLERGRTYVWVVTAIKDGKEFRSPVAPAPEARFKVLERETANDVLKSRQDYRDSHLVSGLVCAQAGLLDEAEREFGMLVRANPKSPLAQRLLHNIKSLRGR